MQSDIAQRLDRRVIWDRGGPEGDAIRASTATLLSRPLDVDAAVQIALLNSNSLQATFEDLGVAQADLVQAGLLLNPIFDGFDRWFNISPAGGPNWNLGLHWPLLQLFLTPLRQKLAGAALDEASLRVTGEVLKEASDTRVAFFAVQADEQVVEARKTVTDLANIAAVFADRQYKVGNIDDLTLARGRATFQDANIASIEADSAVRVSRERLRRAMGLSASNVEWRVEHEIALPPEAGNSESDLVDLAISSSLDVAAARKFVEREQYALELKHKWWLETVTLGVETERASTGGYQTGPDFSLELPIFDQKQAVFARQEALIRQSQRREAAAEDRVRQEVRTALEQMNSASRVARFYTSDVVPLRKQMTLMTEKRYQGMLLGVFELLSVRSDEATAVIATVRARQDYWDAHSELELALGGRLPPSRNAAPNPTTGSASVEVAAPAASQPAKSMPAMPGM